MWRNYLDIQIPVKKTLTYKIRQRIGGWKTSDRSGACRFQRYRRTTGVYSPQKCFERSVRRPGVVKTLPRALLKAPLGKTHSSPPPLPPLRPFRHSTTDGKGRSEEDGWTQGKKKRGKRPDGATSERSTIRRLRERELSGRFPREKRYRGFSPGCRRFPEILGFHGDETDNYRFGTELSRRGRKERAKRARRYYRSPAVSSHRHFGLVLFLLLFVL